MTDPVYDLGDVDVRAGLARAAAQAAAGVPRSKRSGTATRPATAHVMTAAPSPASWAHDRGPAGSSREGCERLALSHLTMIMRPRRIPRISPCGG